VLDMVINYCLIHFNQSYVLRFLMRLLVTASQEPNDFTNYDDPTLQIFYYTQFYVVKKYYLY